MRDFTEISAVSDTGHTQSSRDSKTIPISDNSTTRESIPGITSRIMTDTPSTPTTFPVETDVTTIPAEIPEEVQMHSSNYNYSMPTDVQALTALQSLVSDDFQAKNFLLKEREKRLQIHVQNYKMRHSN